LSETPVHSSGLLYYPRPVITPYPYTHITPAVFKKVNVALYFADAMELADDSARAPSWRARLAAWWNCVCALAVDLDLVSGPSISVNNW